MFERDVNTLNRCFDDIERFVARIQSAALAQREIEQQNHRYRTANRRDKKNQQPPDPNGILFMRAQLPLESEFVDILKKFKLSFNLLVSESLYFETVIFQLKVKFPGQTQKPHPRAKCSGTFALSLHATSCDP